MNDNVSRTARIKSSNEFCQLAYLEKDDFKRIIAFQATEKVNERYHFIKEFSFFQSSFNYRELVTFTYHFNERHFEFGDTVFDALDLNVNEVFFVKEGLFTLQAVFDYRPASHSPFLRVKRIPKLINIEPLLPRALFGVEHFNRHSFQAIQLAIEHARSLVDQNEKSPQDEGEGEGADPEVEAEIVSDPPSTDTPLSRIGRVVCSSPRGSVYAVSIAELEQRLWKEESKQKFQQAAQDSFEQSAGKIQDFLIKSFEEAYQKDILSEQDKLINPNFTCIFTHPSSLRPSTLSLTSPFKHQPPRFQSEETLMSSTKATVITPSRKVKAKHRPQPIGDDDSEHLMNLPKTATKAAFVRSKTIDQSQIDGDSCVNFDDRYQPRQQSFTQDEKIPMSMTAGIVQPLLSHRRVVGSSCPAKNTDSQIHRLRPQTSVIRGGPAVSSHRDTLHSVDAQEIQRGKIATAKIAAAKTALIEKKFLDEGLVDMVELSTSNEASAYTVRVSELYNRNRRNEEVIFNQTARVVQQQNCSFKQVREYFYKLNHRDRFFQDAFIQKGTAKASTSSKIIPLMNESISITLHKKKKEIQLPSKIDCVEGSANSPRKATSVVKRPMIADTRVVRKLQIDSACSSDMLSTTISTRFSHEGGCSKSSYSPFKSFHEVKSLQLRNKTVHSMKGETLTEMISGSRRNLQTTAAKTDRDRRKEDKQQQCVVNNFSRNRNSSSIRGKITARIQRQQEKQQKQQIENIECEDNSLALVIADEIKETEEQELMKPVLEVSQFKPSPQILSPGKSTLFSKQAKAFDVILNFPQAKAIVDIIDVYQSKQTRAATPSRNVKSIQYGGVTCGRSNEKRSKEEEGGEEKVDNVDVHTTNQINLIVGKKEEAMVEQSPRIYADNKQRRHKYSLLSPASSKLAHLYGSPFTQKYQQQQQQNLIYEQHPLQLQQQQQQEEQEQKQYSLRQIPILVEDEEENSDIKQHSVETLPTSLIIARKTLVIAIENEVVVETSSAS